VPCEFGIAVSKAENEETVFQRYGSSSIQCRPNSHAGDALAYRRQCLTPNQSKIRHLLDYSVGNRLPAPNGTMMTMPKRIVVIGGGVVGLCCAYYLEKDGHSVTVLDRGQPETERCSSGNSGLVVPSHFVPLAAPGMVAYGIRQMLNPRSPFRIKPQFSSELVSWLFKFWLSASADRARGAGPVLRDLNMLSRSLYLELGREREFDLEQKGLLMVCRDEITLQKEHHEAETARGLGIPTQTLTADELSKLDASAKYRSAGAVLYPQDCHLNPLRFTNSLRTNLQDIRYGSEVVKMNQDSRGIQSITTERETLEADAFVLAGGVWSAKLASTIGLRLPLQAGKGYSMTLDASEHSPTIPSILVEGRVAITPMGDKLRVGGTMELAGIDDSIDPRRVEGIVNTFCQYLPDFSASNFANQPVWKGLRPCSPDGVPYIGPFAKVPNLYAAAGHAMMGLSLGPATGFLIAQHVAGGKPQVDSSLLRPDRF